MGKVYTCFQTETPQKPDPFGKHIPIWYIYVREYPLGIESSDKLSYHNNYALTNIILFSELSRAGMDVSKKTSNSTAVTAFLKVYFRQPGLK